MPVCSSGPRGVPDPFFNEALSSVLNQTYANLEILVSFDLCNETEANLRHLKKLSNDSVGIRTFVQLDTRLGWLRNVNFLLKEARGDYVAIMPHDDLVPPNYFEALKECLVGNPRAVNCFPQITCIGDLPPCVGIRQANVTGSTNERIMASLINTVGISFRGLIRRSSFRGGDLRPILLRQTRRDHYTSDLAQVTQFAIYGELMETNVSYSKRFHNASTMFLQRTTLSTDESVIGVVDRFANAFGAADGHASSSSWLYNASFLSLQNYVTLHILGNRTITDAQLPQLFHSAVTRRKRVAVLGAGIQGTAMALLFAKHGYDVVLFDKAADLMTRASNNQEGKIHIGFVYSNDRTMRTGKKMVRSALGFAPAVEDLVGRKLDWNAMKSSPFRYLVPHSSLVKPDDLEAFFAKLETYFHDLLKEDSSLSYLGCKPRSLWKRIKLPENINASFFAAAFETEEYAISQIQVKEALAQALLDKSVKLRFDTEIVGVRRNPNGTRTGRFRVATKQGGEHDVDLVVNCLWEGRAAIDRRMGIKQWSGTNVRFKLGVKTGYIGQLTSMPSTTIVNGPFGDFVNFPGEKRMYFSWYPVSMVGMTNDNVSNAEWEGIASGEIPDDLSTSQIAKHENAFNGLFPNLGFRMARPQLVGGFILGNGDKDVDKPDSLLHERDDEPIVHDDGYWSVSTQKFTSAPYHAKLLEKRYLLNGTLYGVGRESETTL
jgi:glycosyltransferase involved in cell wall biosynthesis